MVLILGLNGRKCILFLWTNVNGKCGAAEAAENFNKIPKLCKIYLKNGENSYGIGDRKNVRYHLFFAVIVGKNDFNTQKPVSEKNTLKTPKNSKLP